MKYLIILWLISAGLAIIADIIGLLVIGIAFKCLYESR